MMTTSDSQVVTSTGVTLVVTKTDSYREGGKRGRRFVCHVARLPDEQGEELRSQIAAMRRFRSQQSDNQWHVWEGRTFSFATDGLRCALSVVLLAFPSLLKFVKVRSSRSAEQVCKVVWRMWIAPQRGSRLLTPSELTLLRNSDFVRGFVDAVAGPALTETPKRTNPARRNVRQPR